MVIKLEIYGQSAGLLPNSVMIGYGRVSTTERLWISYDSLINLKRFKIQSTPCTLNKYSERKGIKVAYKRSNQILICVNEGY